MLPHDHIAGPAMLSLFRSPGEGPCGPRNIPAGLEVVELVTDGEASINIDGVWRRVGCGHLLWHLPGEPTICRLLGDPPYECLVITFTITAAVPRPVPRCSVFGDRPATRQFRDELLATYHRRDHDAEALCRYLHALLQWHAHRSSLRSPDPFLPPAIARVLDHIDRHFTEPLEVEDLAAVAGLSGRHLHTLFEGWLQTTPFQVLRRRRLEEGRRLLAGTDWPVRRIAAACGMPDANNFAKRFRHETGMTPIAYRRQHATPAD
jgi:AraC-like DNA-binding protein